MGKAREACVCFVPQSESVTRESDEFQIFSECSFLSRFDPSWMQTIETSDVPHSRIQPSSTNRINSFVTTIRFEANAWVVPWVTKLLVVRWNRDFQFLIMLGFNVSDRTMFRQCRESDLRTTSSVSALHSIHYPGCHTIFTPVVVDRNSTLPKN